MGRNEIRLRRGSPAVGKSHRHKNYSALMRRHNRYLKLKRIIYILYIVVFIFLLILLFMVVRLRKTQTTKAPSKIEVSVNNNGHDFLSVEITAKKI